MTAGFPPTADDVTPEGGLDFDSRVIAVVAAVPEARAMSYGSVAAAVGSRSARGVGRVMAFAGSDLPWWRIVRASGHPPVGHERRALEHHRAEGTPLLWSRGGAWRVDLARAAWWPDDDAPGPGPDDDTPGPGPDGDGAGPGRGPGPVGDGTVAARPSARP